MIPIMRKLIIPNLILFLILSLFLICGCVEREEPSKNLIKASPGSTFTITLDSNPTTGYSWHLKEALNEKNVKLVDNKYLVPETSQLGKGGQEAWTFKAQAKGKTKIIMVYTRSWEKDTSSAKQASYTIIVE